MHLINNTKPQHTNHHALISDTGHLGYWYTSDIGNENITFYRFYSGEKTIIKD